MDYKNNHHHHMSVLAFVLVYVRLFSTVIINLDYNNRKTSL